MKRRALAVLCLTMLILGACNFPTASQPALPRPVPTANGNLAVPEEYLTGVRIASYDPFDNLRGWASESDTGTLSGGVFELRGTRLWHSHLVYKHIFAEGDGLLLSFSVQQANARSELVLVSGEWLTGSFRQFGLYNAPRPLSDLFEGTADLGGHRVVGDLVLQASMTYELLLAVGHGRHLLGVIWNPASPADRAAFEIQGDPSWQGRQWTFMPKATDGETMYLDNFYRIAFSDIK